MSMKSGRAAWVLFVRCNNGYFRANFVHVNTLLVQCIKYALI